MEKVRGVEIGDSSVIESYASIHRGVQYYIFPKDLKELVSLHVEGYYIESIDGREIKLSKVPDHEQIRGLIIRYRKWANHVV